jgi:predicted transcriptional regulator
MTVKEALLQWVQELPDDVDIEDVEYEFWVARRLEKGLQEVEAGRTVPWEEAKRIFQDEINRGVHPVGD